MLTKMTVSSSIFCSSRSSNDSTSTATAVCNYYKIGIQGFVLVLIIIVIVQYNLLIVEKKVVVTSLSSESNNVHKNSTKPVTLQQSQNTIDKIINDKVKKDENDVSVGANDDGKVDFEVVDSNADRNIEQKDISSLSHQPDNIVIEATPIPDVSDSESSASSVDQTSSPTELTKSNTKTSIVNGHYNDLLWSASNRVEYLQSLNMSLTSLLMESSNKNNKKTIEEEEEEEQKRYNQWQRQQFGVEFVLNRMNEYIEQDLLSRWKMRGVGYLYWYWNMILIAEWEQQQQQEDKQQTPKSLLSKRKHAAATTTTSTSSSLQTGSHVITIRNVLTSLNDVDDDQPNQQQQQQQQQSSYHRFIASRTNCHLWTLYVRVNGPEIFAGSATAVLPSNTTTTHSNTNSNHNSSACYWQFPFTIQIPGLYKVDARILYYNATSVMQSRCQSTRSKRVDILENGFFPQNNNTNDTTTATTPAAAEVVHDNNNNVTTNHYIRAGFKGFKMYSPDAMCCEICSRLVPDCFYWSTPPIGLIDPSFTNTGCDLFFTNNQSEWIPISMFVNNTFDDTQQELEQEQEQQPQRRQYYYHHHRLLLPQEQQDQQQNDDDVNSRQYYRQSSGSSSSSSSSSKRGDYYLQRHRRLRILQDNEWLVHGPVHSDGLRDLYFAGCGWSFWMTLDFPCLNGTVDDQIPVFVTSLDENKNNNSNHTSNVSSQSRMDISNAVLNSRTATSSSTVFHGTSSTVFHVMDVDSDESNSIVGPTNTFVRKTTTVDQLPLCTIESEYPENHIGRWVREPWPTDEECPIPHTSMDVKHSDLFFITEYDINHPKCYYREDINRIGDSCVEINCRFINQTLLWYSDLHLERRFYGTWQNYHCQYIDYTNEQLQQCINERKITKITGSGHSIWNYLKQYLNQRLDGLILYKTNTTAIANDENEQDNNENDNEQDSNIEEEGLTIHLSSLSMLHHPIDELETIVQKMDVVNTSKLEYYWINSLYVSSEREHEARGPVQIVKSQLVRTILQPKHYKMLNLYDLSAAFTYDSATQMDGMHIIGLPMKTLISKLFHHVCYNTSISPLHTK